MCITKPICQYRRVVTTNCEIVRKYVVNRVKWAKHGSTIDTICRWIIFIFVILFIISTFGLGIWKWYEITKHFWNI